MPEDRLNVKLPEKLAKKLDDYCVKITEDAGKVHKGVRTTIGRLALEEFLDKHGNDTKIIISKLTKQSE